MNRRKFLQLFGITVSAVSLPAFAQQALSVDLGSEVDFTKPEFDPNQKYGNYIQLSEDIRKFTDEDRFKTFKIVEQDMRNFIPFTHWDRVKYIVEYPVFDEPISEFNPMTIAWKYSPSH